MLCPVPCQPEFSASIGSGLGPNTGTTAATGSSAVSVGQSGVESAHPNPFVAGAIPNSPSSTGAGGGVSTNPFFAKTAGGGTPVTPGGGSGGGGFGMAPRTMPPRAKTRKTRAATFAGVGSSPVKLPVPGVAEEERPNPFF